MASMPEQFAGVREIIKEQNKVARPNLTDEEKELIGGQPHRYQVKKHIPLKNEKRIYYIAIHR